MPSPSEIPVGGYSDVTEVVSAAAQTEILAEIDKLLALVPDTDHSNAQASPPQGTAPLYDKWSPELANAIRVEIAALKTAIDNAPTS